MPTETDQKLRSEIFNLSQYHRALSSGTRDRIGPRMQFRQSAMIESQRPLEPLDSRSVEIEISVPESYRDRARLPVERIE